MLRARVGRGRQERCHEVEKCWDISLRHRPNLAEIDAVVGVDQHVSHSGDFSPGDTRICLADAGVGLFAASPIRSNWC